MKRAVVLFVVLLLVSCTNRPPSHPDRIIEAARFALRRGELSEARTLAERGLKRVGTQSQSEGAWTLRLLRAEILIAQLQLSEALPVLRMPIPAGGRFDPLRARQKYLEARTQMIHGQLGEALHTLDEALLIAPSARDLRFDVDVLAGQICLRTRRWADAESRLTAVVTEAGATDDHYHQAQALNNLGMSRVNRNRYDEAILWFERVLAFKDLEPLSLYGAALNNAGMCYSRLGQFDRAVATQRRAVDFHGRSGRKDFYEQALGELGNTYLQQSNPREALVYLNQALAVATDSALSADAKVAADAALWANDLAVAYLDLGDWDKAEHFNDEGRRLQEATGSGNPVYNTLTAAQIAQGRGLLTKAADLFEQTLADPQADPAIKWSAHAGLGVIASSQKQPKRAASHFEAALDTIEKTRSQLLRTDYKLSYLTRLIAFYRVYVDALVEQQQIDRALEIVDSSRARVLADRQGASLPARGTAKLFRRVAVETHRVLLSYWLASPHSYLWVVTAAGIRCVILPPASEVETLVREYQALIATSTADPLASRDTAGDRLYRMIVQPAEQSLGGLPHDASVVIVPDGALHGVNFDTLPIDGRTRHYWIDDVEIRVAPSLSMLDTATPSRPSRRQSILIMGNPTAGDPEFPALRNAPAEMAKIASHFPAASVTIVQGNRATPSAYREAHPDQFGIVHFTAHAVANMYSPLDSAVILARDEHAYKLYARDVAEQPLHAELVTVSACRSAGERAYSGEGLIGFAWAFLRAGARRVVAGLWDVDDQSTAELMDTLYAHLTNGDPPARALREAKLALMRRGGNFAKPYYWGPFELFTIDAR